MILMTDVLVFRWIAPETSQGGSPDPSKAARPRIRWKSWLFKSTNPGKAPSTLPESVTVAPGSKPDSWSKTQSFRKPVVRQHGLAIAAGDGHAGYSGCGIQDVVENLGMNRVG